LAASLGFQFDILSDRRRRRFAQGKLGGHRAHGFVLGIVGAHQREGLLGPFQIAALEVTACQSRHRLGMARLVLQHMAIGLGGLSDIAGGKGLIGRFQNFGRVVVGFRAPRQSLDELFDLAIGEGAHETVDRLGRS
jgi:hypothetical protein